MIKILMTSAAIAISSTSAFAVTVNTKANVVFLVDESGSMGGEHTFLQNTIEALDAGLLAAGVTDERSYAVVGFGNSSFNNQAAHLIGTGLTDAATAKTNMGTLRTTGGTEDGYQAIQFALDTLAFTAGAAVNFILVTDEDRDNVNGNSLSYASILSALSSKNILLNAILDNSFYADGTRALGVTEEGATDAAYLADGSGGFTNSLNNVTIGSGYGTTTADYVDLALATGGAAWDLDLLRLGGLTADSFSAAFVDIKVSEISYQPPSPSTVPLPAAAWLMMGAFGGVAALARRKARSA